MPTISNDHQRCGLFDLGIAPGGKGPFIIRQEGSAPGSMSLRQDAWLLRRDGVWVLNYVACSTPEEAQTAFLYPTVAEAITALENLSGPPVVQTRPEDDRPPEEIVAALEATAARLIAAMQAGRRVTPP